jgi:O-antigen/teichoic acid export membrane protein|tara:strand:+ start:138 stop:359 length:222 start_codon:yes stop_codon:yes gene_type:complete
MKKITILSILSIFINFVICSNAFAYIDPGTGSILLQALLGALAAAGAAISIYWSKFKSFFKKKPKDDQKDSNN